MMKDLISVIIPVYNVKKYLTFCIDSVLRQSYSNLEIILVDDGSDDKCPQICDDYAKVDNRIRVILDIEGYKAKREKALEDLAEKLEKTVI